LRRLPPHRTFPPAFSRPGAAPVVTVSSRSVTLFGDFTCPFSYFAESLLRGIDDGLEIATRAFELYPEPDELPPLAFTTEEWETIRSLASHTGIAISDVRMRPRTRKAHEASKFASTLGKEAEMRREIFGAYFSDGWDIGRIDVLVELAGRIAIDPDELRIALDIDRHHDAVLHDLHVADRLGIRSTPTIFFGTGPAAKIVVGAPAPDELMRLVDPRTPNGSEEPSDG
jgi:predicted DsbA family dithiol-disulfide isomerase